MALIMYIFFKKLFLQVWLRNYDTNMNHKVNKTFQDSANLVPLSPSHSPITIETGCWDWGGGQMDSLKKIVNVC